MAFAGGPLLPGVPFAPTAVVVRTRAGLVRLGTPPFTPVGTRVGEGWWHVRGRGLRTRVAIDAAASGPHLLLPHPEPADGTLDRRAEHWSNGHVELLVEGRRGGRWRTLAAGSSPLAGLERGRPLPPGATLGTPTSEGDGRVTVATMTDDELARYAAAVVRDCLGTRPGDLVAVHGEPAHRPLAAAIVDAAYRAGARYVDLLYVDGAAKRSRIAHADVETLGYMPPWHAARMRHLLAQDASIVSITGESEPGLMGALDPAKAARERTGRLPGQPVYIRALQRGRARFCVVAWPVPGWAREAYPELDPEEAARAVAEDLLRFCRLAPDDAPDAWAQHLAGARRAGPRPSTRSDLTGIELRGAGTSLDVGLAPSTRWLAALTTDHTGRSFCANLPTEEVFTSPDYRRADGTFTCTRPLSLDGRSIAGIRGELRGGRLVRIDADEPSDRDFLAGYLARDAGASRLGELALLDSTSRIGQAGRSYGLTLLDENAAGHIAFGSSYGGTRTPGAPARGTGLNRSSIHVDVMIGAPEQEVHGVRRDGSRVALIAGGLWQIA